MELENTDKITSLLHNISLYDESKSYNSSFFDQSESQNFHIKLMKLIEITKESSFSNMQIELKYFFKDIERFLEWVINERE